MDKNTFFVSGHRDLTEEEFAALYIPAITKACNTGGRFVIGDYHGADIMAQKFICDLGYADKLTVYHMGTIPMNIDITVRSTVPGFTSDIERDSAMTKNSDYDIAFVREGRWDSGTAQNIIRRAEFKL